VTSQKFTQEETDDLTVVQLLWSNYSQAVTSLQEVMKEKYDGSPDWDKFHNFRREAAIQVVETTKGLYNRYQERPTVQATMRRAYASPA